LKKFVIAIDGPAASGKSTTARLAAERLGYLFIDTGAMYRAMTLKVLEQGIDPSDAQRIGEIAQETRVELRREGKEARVFLDGKDVTDRIRSRGVTNAVSGVSAVQKVRDVMVREQQRLGERGGVILDGRDIGTVVFPGADLKIFMLADVGTRALRRQKEMAEQEVHVRIDELAQELRSRDRKDSERENSPLKKAGDAIVLDTSQMSIEEQVQFILTQVEKLEAKHADGNRR
jgi:cytidylate kinase